MKKKLISVLLVAMMLLSCIPLCSVSVSAEEYEYALFPGSVLKVTQGAYAEFSPESHNGQTGYVQNAFDFGGNTNYRAPFSGTITRIKTSYNAVVLQSDDKVYWANGTLDYMSVTFVHDNDVSDLYVGKHINQGDVFYQAGNKGSVDVHLHLCVNKGKTTDGSRYFSGDTRPNEAFFLDSSVVLQQTGNYRWEYLSSPSGPHSHYHDKYVYYQAEHPHYRCYQCSCGDVAANYSTAMYVDTCAQCKTMDTINSGTYLIKNNSRQEFMNVEYGTDANAQNIRTGAFGDWSSMKYEIAPSTTTTGYAMRPLSSGSRMVNVYGNTVSNGNNVCIWDNTGHDSQRWSFKKVNSGYVIHNVQNPSCVLDVQSDGNVIVSTYTGVASQIWSLQNTVSYDANGGTGAPDRQFKDYDNAIQLSGQIPTKDGYTFLGWSTDPAATTATYSAGATYTNNTNVTLYAVWEPTHPYSNYGDVNGDSKVNIKDLGLLQQYLNGWDVDLSTKVADVNGDGKVNIKDLGLLQQYLNGWDIELK